jgi:hypothetical protein
VRRSRGEGVLREKTAFPVTVSVPTKEGKTHTTGPFLGRALMLHTPLPLSRAEASHPFPQDIGQCCTD